MLKRTLRQAMLLPLVLVGLARSATATRGSLSDEIQRILDVSADATGFAFSAGCVHAVCVLIITSFTSTLRELYRLLAACSTIAHSPSNGLTHVHRPHSCASQ